MFEWLVVVLVAYVQCGLLLACYLFHRRVVVVRQESRALQAAGEASRRGLEAKVAELQRQVRELGIGRPPAARQGGAAAFRQAKRRGVLEMARGGLDARHIAEALNVRRAEVEMLLRLERFQQKHGPEVQSGVPDWLETAS